MAPLSLSEPAAPVSIAWGASLVEDLAGSELTLPSGAAPAAAARASIERARRLLREQPLPSRRQEAWRFTDTGPLAAIRPVVFDAEARRLAALAADALPAPHPQTLRLRLDRGSDPLAGIALPAGLELIDASAWPPGFDADARPDQEPWSAAVAAAAGPLLALRVRSDAAVSLELVSDAGAAEGVLPLQLQLVIEPGARLELLQVHRAAGASLTAVQLQIHVGAGARLQHGLIARGTDGAVLLADLSVRQEPASEVAFTSVVSGWGLSRLEPRMVQVAGAASTRLRSLQRCDRRQVADQHSNVRFEGPEGTLDQLHKAIAAGAGRSVFNGAVAVPRAAQRTDAAQLSRGLLLSDRARIDTKPQLEIVADDVKCAHGATVTRLQEEELFYLRSRGINAATAGELLLRGFCDEVLRELPAAAALWQPLQSLLGEEAPTP